MAVNNLAPSRTGADRCRLLELPAELRNYIYELVVSEPEIVAIRGCVQQPGLTRTKRQIRAETITLYYETNTFQLRCSSPTFWPWLNLNTMHIASINNIRIVLCSGGCCNIILRSDDASHTYELSSDPLQSTMYNQVHCSKRHTRDKVLKGGREKLCKMLEAYDRKRLDKYDINFLVLYLWQR